MTSQAIRLSRIELTVADLARAERFYVEALGFQVLGRDDAEPAMAALYGVDRINQVALRRGEQDLWLQAFSTVGTPYPAGSMACDQVFQHFAMPVADMAAAYARLAPFGATPISSAGPQQLPASSGGATAYKFRDPDGHPLELIQFAQGGSGGIDHSAIAVTDVERSIAFYVARLGFQLAARQVNAGIEQDHLDGLTNARVDVVALQPSQPTPHLELLAYHTPPGRPAPAQRPSDIAATRLVWDVTGLSGPAVVLGDGSQAALSQDPDGHFLLSLERRR